MDPNRHMRHTAYNDYAAQTRVAMFTEYNLPIEQIGSEFGLGPILFREEIEYRSEITMMERITVTAAVQAMRRDGSRWTFRHLVLKGNEKQSAVITVDGAWLDLEKRKLGIPPDSMLKTVTAFPRTDDFTWLD